MTIEPGGNAMDRGLNDLRADLAVARREAHVERNLLATSRDATAYVQSIVDTVREPMLLLDGTFQSVAASHAFVGEFGVAREDTEGQFLYDLGKGQWNIPALRHLLEGVTKDGGDFRDFEVRHDFPQLERRVMLINAKSIWSEQNNSALVLMVIEDVTERKRLSAWHLAGFQEKCALVGLRCNYPV